MSPICVLIGFVRLLHCAWRWIEKSVVLIALTVIGASAFAQNDSRLTQLLQKSLEQHPSILQARSQAQAAGFDLDAAKWSRYPALSTELRSDSTFVQSIAKLEQPIWTGGRIEGRIDLAQANVTIANAAFEEAQVTAMIQVSGAFFDLLRLKDRLKTADDNVSEHQRLVSLISRRVKAQISPPADATLAQARLQQALTERLQIQRQLDTTINNLAQWVGPIAQQVLPPSRINYQRPPQVDIAVQNVMLASNQRQKLQAQIESAQAQIDLSKAQGMPTLVAGYQQIVSGPLSSGMDRGRGYIGLQYQPGAGLSAMSAISSAVAKKEASQQELLVLERNLQMQAQTLYSDIDVLESQLAPAQALRQGTIELVDSYLRQYQIGRKNWLDVLNALREKSQAIYNATDVQFSLLQSQVKLMLMMGQIQNHNYAAIHE